MVLFGTFFENVVATLPPIGVISGVAFTINVHAPTLFSETIGTHSTLTSNALWAATNIGSATYFYHANTMHSSPSRLYYSILGSVVFNFGTLLLVKTAVDAACPPCQHLKALVGVSCCLAVAASAKHYVDSTSTAAEQACAAKLAAASTNTKCPPVEKIDLRPEEDNNDATSSSGAEQINK